MRPQKTFLETMMQNAWEEWHSGQECKDNIPSAINPCFSAGYRAGIKELGLDVMALTEELRRAEDLHLEWPEDTYHQVGKMLEEAGEAWKEANNIDEGHGDYSKLVTEMRHTGTMVLRFLKNLKQETK